MTESTRSPENASGTGSPATECSPSSDPTAGQLKDECQALIRYIARHGDVLNDNDELEQAYKELVAAVASKDCAAMHMSYAAVTRHTQAIAGVSGRSILDTWETEEPAEGQGRRRRLQAHRRPLRLGFWFFVAALGLQAVAGIAGRVSDPDALSSVVYVGYGLVSDLFPLLLAAVWGGIGSCIFLVKKLSDRLSSLTYERSRQKGDKARIAVGALLGVAVVELFFSDYGRNLMSGEMDFGPNLAALLAGLAVKPVYGAFEALAEALAQRIGGRGNSANGPRAGAARPPQARPDASGSGSQAKSKGAADDGT